MLQNSSHSLLNLNFVPYHAMLSGDLCSLSIANLTIIFGVGQTEHAQRLFIASHVWNNPSHSSAILVVQDLLPPETGHLASFGQSGMLKSSTTGRKQSDTRRS